MNRVNLNRFATPPMLATAVAAVLFAVVLAAWLRVLSTPATPLAAIPAAPAPLDVTAGAQLFGAPPDGARDAIQLLGILAFDAHHAAAIVSLGGDAARVVRLGGALGSATLAEVHARSIVVDNHGLRREIALPAAPNPTAFVR